MGNLPKNRVIYTSYFHTTGVYFTEPLNIKSKNGKGGLFNFLTTGAIHLQFVSELTFVNIFRRVISHRDKPVCVWSDNGSNFVETNSHLTELALFCRSQVLI